MWNNSKAYSIVKFFLKQHFYTYMFVMLICVNQIQYILVFLKVVILLNTHVKND